MTAGAETARVWGGRARLGLIVPTTNTVNEAEWAAMRMDGVTVHSARMPLHAVSAGDDASGLPAILVETIGQLTPAQPTSLAYSCTAGSMVTPAEAMPAAMSALAELPCTSTAAAIVAALETLKAGTVAIATPYHDALNTQSKSFLEDCGFSVTSIQGLGIGAGGPDEFTRIARLDTNTVRDHAIDSFRRGPADVLLLSCTDMPTLHLLDELEQILGVAVLSSNTATLWRTLQLSGVEADIDRAGKLLAARGTS